MKQNRFVLSCRSAGTLYRPLLQICLPTHAQAPLDPAQEVRLATQHLTLQHRCLESLSCSPLFLSSKDTEIVALSIDPHRPHQYDRISLRWERYEYLAQRHLKQCRHIMSNGEQPFRNHIFCSYPDMGESTPSRHVAILYLPRLSREID